MPIERFILPDSLSQTAVLDRVRMSLSVFGFKPEEQVMTPWGAFLTFNPNDADKFHLNFYGHNYLDLMREIRTPKLLIVSAGKQLSWQVHQKRVEFWKVINGPIGVKTSETDDEPEFYRVAQSGDVSHIQPGIRHRLSGLDCWGVVAEMWLHSNTQNLSTEDDILRINDQFGRQ